MARMKKVDLVAKIAKEQNLDPAQLERLPMAELEKMDKIIPDSDGGDILGDEPVSPTGPETSPVVAQDTLPDAPVIPSGTPDAGANVSSDQVEGSEDGSQEVSSMKAPDGKVWVGNHPVTGAPVYE